MTKYYSPWEIEIPAMKQKFVVENHGKETIYFQVLDQQFKIDETNVLYFNNVIHVDFKTRSIIRDLQRTSGTSGNGRVGK